MGTYRIKQNLVEKSTLALNWKKIIYLINNIIYQIIFRIVLNLKR